MSAVQEAQVKFMTQSLRDSITRPANTTVYASADAISASDDSHFSWDNAVRRGVLSGSIATARLHSSANAGTKLSADLLLFSEDPATQADNGAATFTDAEALTLIGKISFAAADWTVLDAAADAAGNAVCEVKNVGLVFRLKTANLYGQLVARNAYTPYSGEIFTVDLVVTQD